MSDNNLDSTQQFYVSRGLKIPDNVRVARYQRLPEMGPNILFFSGGTALHKFSKQLKNFTHNSVHFMTPYDSGGSSAELRAAFDMPAIGDLRARLMALADESVRGMPEIFKLFSYRLSKHANPGELLSELNDMVTGKHPLINAVSEPMRQLIVNQLQFFSDSKPDNFDLHGASIGNLIIAGGYLNNGRHLDPIVFLFSKLVEVKGIVRLTVNDNYHLAVDLEDGKHIIGQHQMTGKEHPPISSKITNMQLSSDLEKIAPVHSCLPEKHRQFILNADLICFPPGSFYSSIMASLLPKGVGSAIAQNDNAKVYIPSLGDDPEMLDLTTDDAIQALLDYMAKDLEQQVPVNQLLSHVLIDSQRSDILKQLNRAKWQALGIQIIEADLITDESAPYYDTEKLIHAILSFT